MVRKKLLQLLLPLPLWPLQSKIAVDDVVVVVVEKQRHTQGGKPDRATGTEKRQRGWSGVLHCCH
jgi:hypothetical protein